MADPAWVGEVGVKTVPLPHPRGDEFDQNSGGMNVIGAIRLRDS